MRKQHETSDRLVATDQVYVRWDGQEPWRLFGRKSSNERRSGRRGSRGKVGFRIDNKIVGRTVDWVEAISVPFPQDMKANSRISFGFATETKADNDGRVVITEPWVLGILMTR